MRKRFKHPYHITAHAIKRFQEKVANLPSSQVIDVIQEALQEPGLPVELERRDSQLCPTFKCNYKGHIYYVPVCKGFGDWPAVPTVHGRGSIISERVKKGEKKGCEVYERKSKHN